MLNLIFSIDDDRVTQMLNQMVFSRTAFAKKCLPFMNGFEAINYFKQLNEMGPTPDKIPAVIFLDLNMPVLDGWQFLEKIEEKVLRQFPGIKIAISSSSTDPAEKQRAEDNKNVIVFLKKPITPDMINALKHHPELKKDFGECNRYSLLQGEFAASN